MEIKIDTNKDSKEHIEHMISFLQNFVAATSSGASTSSVPMMNMFDQPATSPQAEAPAPAEGIFGLFDSPEPSPQASESVQTMSYEEKPKEPSRDTIEIIPY